MVLEGLLERIQIRRIKIMKKIIRTLIGIFAIMLAVTTTLSANKQPSDLVEQPQYCWYVVGNIHDLSSEKARPKAKADILSRHPDAIFHGATVTFLVCGPGIPIVVADGDCVIEVDNATCWIIGMVDTNQ